jgi:hypothetical protein
LPASGVPSEGSGFFDIMSGFNQDRPVFPVQLQIRGQID